MTGQTIILAAGGTGGHLYPAEALAQELLNRGHKIIIITDKRGNAFQKLSDKVHIDCVRAATFREGLVNKLKAAADIAIGILQAALLMKKYKPDVVIGFGGYPSYPTVFSAQKLGIATILHEQNAVLGKANVHLSAKAVKIAVSLPDTRGISSVNQSKVVVTGNPVRAAICAVREKPYQPPSGSFNIFITGGSQGAVVFSEVVPEAMGLLPADIKSSLSVVHQCREADVALAERKYKAAGLKAEIKSFYNDMPERLGACHLFIGRSGASTVAEIAVVGRPAIFVPYPGHADQQQKYNAELISGRGGAWVMMQDEFKPEALSKKIEQLAKNPSMLENAATAARSCGQPEAVKRLADLIDERLKI